MTSKAAVATKTAVTANTAADMETMGGAITGGAVTSAVAEANPAWAYDETGGRQEISGLFDLVTDRVCADCGMSEFCWKMNCTDTYRVMFDIVGQLDRSGRVVYDDLPEWFLDRCVKLDSFIQGISGIYEIHKVSLIWKDKIDESKGLVSMQMEGLSNMVEALRGEIESDYYANAGNIEDKIVFALEKRDFRIKEISISENDKGRYEIQIVHSGCGGNLLCAGKMEHIISRACGRRVFANNGGKCSKGPECRSCKLHFSEYQRYKLLTGIASLPKAGEAVSGDSHTFAGDDTGSCFMILSDGMGSGRRALEQSETTVNLLEKLLESGVNKENSIKIVTSALSLRTDTETYATIDLTEIDLFEGVANFVKIGAAPSYIKGRDGISALKSASCPAGVFDDVCSEAVSRCLDHGDMIFMVSDGLYNAFNRGADDMLMEYIAKMGMPGAQNAADSIMSEAYLMCGGEPEDDMLVLTGYVHVRNP
jgi:stage II sporulation protein E